MFVDYRAHNSVTVKDKYPIPMVEELLDELRGSTIFFKLDHWPRYYQIKLNLYDIMKISFRIHEGHSNFFEGFQVSLGIIDSLIKRYGGITAPLIGLLKKNDFHRAPEAKKSFCQIEKGSNKLSYPSLAKLFRTL